MRMFALPVEHCRNIFVGLTMACGMLLLLGGCAQDPSHPVPSTKTPTAAPVAPPTVNDTVVATSTPSRETSTPVVSAEPTTPTPGPVSPMPRPTVVWPTLSAAEPASAPPGAGVKLFGSGGYLFTPPGRYDESARTFEVSFDGEVTGAVECYANRCLGEITLPDDIEPGIHTVTVEGGSRISVDVSGEPPE